MLKYGYYYAGALVTGAAVITYLTRWTYGLPFYILAAFCLNFFRDPERRPPDDVIAVSPADGRVVDVRRNPLEPSRISIFMNIFDVHVNRAPIGGRVSHVQYKKGEFLAANREPASELNEQNIVSIEGVVNGRPTTVVVKQIAGLIARRIICYKRAGDRVVTGERIGLIKFGSRVDVLLGPEWDITAQAGQKLRAGSSVIAKMAAARETAA